MRVKFASSCPTFSIESIPVGDVSFSSQSQNWAKQTYAASRPSGISTRLADAGLPILLNSIQDLAPVPPGPRRKGIPRKSCSPVSTRTVPRAPGTRMADCSGEELKYGLQSIGANLLAVPDEPACAVCAACAACATCATRLTTGKP